MKQLCSVLFVLLLHNSLFAEYDILVPLSDTYTMADGGKSSESTLNDHFCDDVYAALPQDLGYSLSPESHDHTRCYPYRPNDNYITQQHYFHKIRKPGECQLKYTNGVIYHWYAGYNSDITEYCGFICDKKTDLECTVEIGNDLAYFDGATCSCRERCTPVLPAPSNKTLLSEFESYDECIHNEVIYNGYRDLECMVNYCSNGPRHWYLYGNEDNGTCKDPNTNYTKLAANERELFSWKDDNDRSDECTQKEGDIQSRQVSCETEYRCVKAVEKDPDECRNQTVGSYVSPTAGVFHIP